MRASEQQWSSLLSHNPAVLDVVRHDRSHIELRTQVGYARLGFVSMLYQQAAVTGMLMSIGVPWTACAVLCAERVCAVSSAKTGVTIQW